MPTTSRGLRYPASSAAPNVPQDMQNLADDVDGALPKNWVTLASSANNYLLDLTTTWTTLTGMSGSVTVPNGRHLDIQFRAPALYVSDGFGYVRLLVAGAVVGTPILASSVAATWTPCAVDAPFTGTGASVLIEAQGSKGTGGVASVRGADIGPVLLRYRIV